jgi:hypothetical protein
VSSRFPLSGKPLSPKGSRLVAFSSRIPQNPPVSPLAFGRCLPRRAARLVRWRRGEALDAEGGEVLNAKSIRKFLLMLIRALFALINAYTRAANALMFKGGFPPFFAPARSSHVGRLREGVHQGGPVPLGGGQQFGQAAQERRSLTAKRLRERGA